MKTDSVVVPNIVPLYWDPCVCVLGWGGGLYELGHFVTGSLR